MADDQCDLDALAAILDQDTNDFPGMSPTISISDDNNYRNMEGKSDIKLCKNNCVDSDDQCDLDTLTSFLEQDSSEDEKSVKPKNDSKKEDVCQADIEAFLNESDSDSDWEKELKKDEGTEIQSSDANRDMNSEGLQEGTEIPCSDANRDMNSEGLQAELMMMQKRMKDLEKQLMASQQSKAQKESDVNLFFGEDKECRSKVNINPKPSESICSTNTPVKTVTLPDRKEMSNAIFGDNDDDDSDWDDMDGERNGLSKEGKEIKKLVKSGKRKRDAHTPFSGYTDYRSTETWKSQPNSLRSPSTHKQTSTTIKTNEKPVIKQDDEKFVLEKNSGIRIIKPLISSAVLELKMDGRKFIKVSKLHQKVKTQDLQGNWVTFGVVVNKTDPKTASSGKTFCIWKLSDLDDCDRTVSFFLFGQVYKEHWKNLVGSVIGLLNPNMMDPADKSPSEVAFTITHPNQMLIMGQAKDLGWCIGKTKSGKKCTNFINTKFGGFCAFHVQSAYKKASSKRSEFQGSMTGVTPKSFEKKIFPKGSHYMYGGQTFSSMQLKSNAKKKQDQLTVKKLMSVGGKQKVTTMSLHELKQDDKEKIEKHLVSDKEQSFIDMVTTPSSGSMNLVKYLVKSELKQEEAKREVPLISITPKELLQEHRKQMLAKKNKRLACLGQQPTPAPDPLKATPTLGRGFYPGQDVLLDASKKQNGLTDRAKLLAISKVQLKGGCKKENPNAVKKISPVQDRIKKRVLENIESNNDGCGASEEPPKKKSRLLGNVDLKSPEVQKLLKAKSCHMGAYREAEAEREEKYFDLLEKKEKMEEKMKSVTEVPCVVFTCKQCKYTAMSLGDKCKSERHDVTKNKAKKRFFECRKCKQRTVDFNKLPSQPCRNCGEYNYERTCMYRERVGPKLDSEKLCIRGDEIKNLNSLNENVYL